MTAVVPRTIPRSDPADDAWAQVFPAVVGVGISAIEHSCLSVEEIEAIQRERREALARRRPCGFMSDWGEQPGLRRVA